MVHGQSRAVIEGKIDRLEREGPLVKPERTRHNLKQAGAMPYKERIMFTSKCIDRMK